MILIIHNGRSTCYYRKKELEAFNAHIAKKAAKDPKYIRKMCEGLISEANGILAIIMKFKGARIGKGEHGIFLNHLYSYVNFHIPVKRLPDALPPETLSKELPKLEGARVHAKPVYSQVEGHMEHLGRQIGIEKGIPENLILCATKEEIEQYFKHSKLPSMDKLKAEDASTALIFIDGKCELIVGKAADRLEEALHGDTQISELKGTCAYPGKAVGKARIILDPKKGGNFKKGILVASMTRPEYIHLMKLAGAVVTDAGGMLSHAAITARELKIPTVVGTERATKAFKEGELAEVDATAGKVSKAAK